MPKYHINHDGDARECKAQKSKCPYGDSEHHFQTLKAARKAYERAQESGGAARKPLWSEITRETILALDNSESVSILDQLEELGFERGSEGTKTSLVWRKFWYGNLRSQDLDSYRDRLVNSSSNTRIGGSVLLLTLLANGRPLKCEYEGCTAEYNPQNPQRVVLEVDHKNPWAYTKDNSLENLQILCSWHHKMMDTGSASDLYRLREDLLS